MTDVDAARRALEDALGPDDVLSDPLALKLYARDASMVEGGCALVAFPRSTDDIVACVRIAAEHGLPIVPRGSGTGLAGAATPVGDALVVVTAKMHDIVEVRTEDRLAWVEPGLPNLDLSNAAAAARVLVRARPVVAADVIDRRQREHERRRPALPGVRRHVGARARAGRRDAGRDRRAPRERGARGGRLRPARRRRRLRRDARDRRARLRAADPAPTRRPHDAAGLHGRERLRRDRVGHHRARRRAGGRRDDGPRHHRGRRELRARRVSRRTPPRS